MRRSPKSQLLGSVLLLAVAWSGCSKPKVAEVAPEEPASAAATPAAATPIARSSVATPAPMVKRLAPDGIYFLLRGKSVETADGITGLKPGMTVVKQADGSFLAGSQKLRLRPDEITNDLDIAARTAGVDAQRQAAIRQASAAALPGPTPAAANPRTASAASQSTRSDTPAATSNAAAAASAPRAASTLTGSSSLGGSAHTMTKDGWVWEKNDYGEWRRSKPLR